MKYIIVPGYQGSPEGHWQNWLLGKLPNSKMVEFRNLYKPVREEWISELEKEIESCDEDFIIIAHSMGAVTTANLTKSQCNRHLRGVILVAPADSEQADFPKEIENFSPMPQKELPFPTLLIGSRNDHYMKYSRVVQLADRWGSSFLDVGCAGHINGESGFDVWYGFLDILSTFEEQLTQKQLVA